MLGQPQMAAYQLSRYHNERVTNRKGNIAKTISGMCKILQDILKEVEVQEPRFISTLVYNEGRYDGVYAVTPTEYEVILYLNQMGVFNFVDDGNIAGAAVLKLSDGRKRSMSLWVEFITASGYLSARKIRCRFYALVKEAVEKSPYRDLVKVMGHTSDVKLRIHDKFTVTIVCAFRCTGIWPKSACDWPASALLVSGAQPPPPGTVYWPRLDTVEQIKSEGFDLLSRECLPGLLGSGAHKTSGNQTSGNQTSTHNQQVQSASSVEGDAWAMSFNIAEDILLMHSCRRRAYSILKTLRDTHLDFPDTPITAYILKTLLLFECEKHPHESEWGEVEIAERIIGILLQLVSSLQCRRCPHYFLPKLDLLMGRPTATLDQAAKQTWRLLRQLITDPRALEKL